MFEPGQRVVIRDASNLPCDAGDTGVVIAVRQAARDFPVGVKIDGNNWTDWFRESEIEPAAD